MSAALAATVGVTASPAALAHSFGQTFTLPMPFELYAWASAAVLVATFLLMLVKQPNRGQLATGSALRAEHAQHNSPPKSKIAGLIKKYALRLIQVIGLMGLLLSIYSGLEGTPRRTNNFNMTWFWVIWMLLLVYVSGLIGNVYRAFNPFATLSTPLTRLELKQAHGKAFSQRERTQNTLLALFSLFALLCFGYYELFGQARPYDLSIALIIYAVIYSLLRIAVGHEKLTEHGDFFSIYFDWLGRCATSLKNLGAKRKLRDLHQPANNLIQVAFIVALFGITAYDGLKDTEYWAKNIWPTFARWLAQFVLADPQAALANPLLMNFQMGPYFTLFEKVSYGLFPCAVGLTFWLAVWAGGHLCRITNTSANKPPSTRELALAFAPALVPILLVYSFSHYFTLILTQGVQIVHLISDPLGQGWNLLGTRNLARAPILLDVQWIWNIQLVSIILGHVVSAIISHNVAFERLPSRLQANVSQLPILLVMILLTVFGLWILSQPLQIG